MFVKNPNNDNIGEVIYTNYDGSLVIQWGTTKADITVQHPATVIEVLDVV